MCEGNWADRREGNRGRDWPKRGSGQGRGAARAGRRRAGELSGRVQRRPRWSAWCCHRAPEASRGATGQADKEEGQADDGKEEPDPALEGEDLGLEFLLVHGKDLGGDDGTGAATDPTCGGGARDTEVTEQHRVAFFADEVAHAVVIRTTAG